METTTRTYAALTGADPKDVTASEPRNGAIQVAALTLTKTADKLIDPKLVLAWLMGALGAPAALTGWLVPVREAGSLLPQLALARWVEATARRKWVWALGSAMQGLAALGIGAAALTLEGAAAGWAIIASLAVLALARSLCSLSHKDTLARSIPKTRRGAVSGVAGAVGAAAAFAYGGMLAVGLIPLTPLAISGAILVAGAFWLFAAAIFTRLEETPDDDASPGERSGFAALIAPLREDPQLRRFIAARGLLTATALAPPYLVLLSSVEEGARIGALGPLVLASAAASILSSYVWGRVSDRSSRQTLMAAGGLAAVVLAAAALAGWMTGGLGGVIGAAATLFVAQIAYEGVRAGRKLHLTDMTTDADRARYTAVSNTTIGLLLLVGGAVGGLAAVIGPAGVLAVFAAAAALSIPVSAGLREVQRA